MQSADQQIATVDHSLALMLATGGGLGVYYAESAGVDVTTPRGTFSTGGGKNHADFAWQVIAGTEVAVFDEGAELGSRNTQPKRRKMDQWFARGFSS